MGWGAERKGSGVGGEGVREGERGGKRVEANDDWGREGGKERWKERERGMGRESRGRECRENRGGGRKGVESGERLDGGAERGRWGWG